MRNCRHVAYATGPSRSSARSIATAKVQMSPANRPVATVATPRAQVPMVSGRDRTPVRSPTAAEVVLMAVSPVV